MGSGFLVNGAREMVPGLNVSNRHDDPVLTLKMGEDGESRPASTQIRVIVLHTTKGLAAGAPLPGFGPTVEAGQRVARFWMGDGRQAGAHIVIDHDGRVSCLADLQLVKAWHCPKWNDHSIGIELYQGAGGQLYEGQLETCVRVCDYLTRRFRIQRQVTHKYVGPLDRFLPGDPSVVGIIGHRDAARNRGEGDPGNAIFNRLGSAGYEPVNFDLREDLERWRRRQYQVGMRKDDGLDGIPGPRTCAAVMAKRGHPAGLWVTRPGDFDAAGVG